MCLLKSLQQSQFHQKLLSPMKRACQQPLLKIRGHQHPSHHNMVVTDALSAGKDVTNKATLATSSKGKEIVDEKAQAESHKKNVSPKESQEFLRLIRKSDFKIMDQLGQTPSKISIL